LKFIKLELESEAPGRRMEEEGSKDMEHEAYTHFLVFYG
jgi:hypothetical protein